MSLNNSRGCGAAVLLAAACAGAHAGPTDPGGSPPGAPAAATADSRPSPSASASTAPPAASAYVPSAGDLGTASPLAVQATAPDGSWIVLCQARADTDGDGQVTVSVGPHGELAGDELETYLVLGTGEGQRVDELVAADGVGHFLVLRRAGKLVLLDTRARAETDLSELGADDRSDRLTFLPHRSVSLDRAGTRLMYVRRGQTRNEVVIRKLDDGSEATVDPGPGALWRAQLDETGTWVILRMLVSDTNGNGRLDWPVPPAPETRRPCAGPIPRFVAWQGRGDEPVTLVAPSTGGKATFLPTFVAPFGKDLLVREPGGRLLLRRGGRKRVHQLAPANCQAKVLHADAARQLVVGTCTPKQGRPQVNLLGVTFRDELQIEVAPQVHDRWPEGSPRLVPLYPGREAVLLDLDRRTTHALRADDRVLGTWRGRALVRRDRSLVLYDADRKQETALPGRTAHLLTYVTQGALVAVHPLVVDLDAGQVLGAVVQRPLAVTGTGRVLVATGGEPSAEGLAAGPLRWVAPSPSPIPGSPAE